MPLLLYFATIGTLLTAVLLLVNLMLEPSTPERSKPAAAEVARSLPKPRTTTGSASTYLVAPSPPAAAAPLKVPQDTTVESEPPRQQSSRDETVPKPLTREKRRSRRVHERDRGRNTDFPSRHDRGNPDFSAYAREAPSWHSPAEGTLGPH